MSRSDRNVTATPKLVQYTEITTGNIDSFHLHGDPADYPITAVVAVPHDARSGAILRGRYVGAGSETQTQQILVPGEVIAGLLADIFRIRNVLDAVILVVGTAFWMPDPETIAAYQGADLILLNGADYAKWTARVSLPRSRLVNTSRGFKDRYIQQPNMVSHSHGPSGQHAHGGAAFTTWLDLDQAAQQAEAIARALVRERPNAKDRIERNLQSLRGDLLGLDGRIGESTRFDSGRPLLASHPVYQYLARRHALNLRSLMWEPEELPSEGQWSALEGILQAHPARWMIWEGEPAEKTVERLRTLGVESVVLDPCSNRPSAGDFLTVMTDNVRGLQRVFGQVSGAP